MTVTSSSTKNVKLGACRITYDGKDLGLTKGGVEVDVTTETHPVTVDQYGESIINEYITKRNIKVSCPLAETTLENLVAIMPGAKKIDDASSAKATGSFIFATNPSPGTTQARAKFLIMLAVNPSPNDTISIGTSVITFVAPTATLSAPSSTAMQVKIAGNVNDTTANLANAINSQNNTGNIKDASLFNAAILSSKTGSATANNSISMTAINYGTASNNITLSTGQTNTFKFYGAFGVSTITATGGGVNDSPGDTISINGKTIEFNDINSTINPSNSVVVVGTDLSKTLLNLTDHLLNYSYLYQVTPPTVQPTISSQTTYTITALTSGTVGNNISLSCTNITTANISCPTSTLTNGSGSSSSLVQVTNGVGIDLLSNAKKLQLHPIALNNSDLSQDVIINKAATPGAMKFSFKHNEERVFNTEFNGYPDLDNNNILFSIGDTSIIG